MNDGFSRDIQLFVLLVAEGENSHNFRLLLCLVAMWNEVIKNDV